MTTYTIYTDGACINNGKADARAGWGAVLRNPEGDVLEIAGPVPESQPQTNGRAELLALVEALERCAKPAPIILYTDSQYIANACNGWLPDWKARGWRKADKKPPEHLDLWQRLDQQLQAKDVSVCWVKAHSGMLGNERADALANIGAAGKNHRKRVKKPERQTNKVQTLGADEITTCQVSGNREQAYSDSSVTISTTGTRTSGRKSLPYRPKVIPSL
ncbi:ribonuclease H family protein [Stutzerimonas stutzeri]|uniref:ribonuclease H family protein n=1 Tax=Stutzerimonas stutzeri TaxID=316 RepID=UPI000F796F32|nr:ribonuclease H [Stutzerimonas stutzeri]MCQ4239695.1 ribonuclease HI [Stutzerimonas stutzeri]RRV65104.1 ribonuclease HI [Stutzerimonas stutzeri]